MDRIEIKRRLRTFDNKRRAGLRRQTPFDNLMNTLAVELETAENAVRNTSAGDWERRMGWLKAIEHVLSLAMESQEPAST